MTHDTLILVVKVGIEAIINEYDLNQFVDHPNYFAEDIIKDLQELLKDIENVDK